jgi:hypothetical protein
LSFIRRAVTIAVGLLCAATLAFILLPVAVILDPTLHDANPSWLAFGFLAMILQADDPERVMASVMFIWTAMVTVCVLPLAIAALAGEAARVRAWLWYAAGTGILAAGMPLAIRAGLGSAPLRQQADAATQAAETRLLLLFFLTGVLSGSLYWLMAGRRAGAGGRDDRGAP